MRGSYIGSREIVSPHMSIIEENGHSLYSVFQRLLDVFIYVFIFIFFVSFFFYTNDFIVLNWYVSYFFLSIKGFIGIYGGMDLGSIGVFLSLFSKNLDVYLDNYFIDLSFIILTLSFIRIFISYLKMKNRLFYFNKFNI